MIVYGRNTDPIVYVCDEPGCSARLTTTTGDIAEASRQRKAAGWTCSGVSLEYAFDWCPAHSPKPRGFFARLFGKD
jgi:hypothetical protein